MQPVLHVIIAHGLMFSTRISIPTHLLLLQAVLRPAPLYRKQMPCALRRLKARAEQERFLQEAEEAKQKADGSLSPRVASQVAGLLESCLEFDKILDNLAILQTSRQP